MSEKDKLDLIQAAYKDVENGLLTEGSFFFLVGMILQPKPSEEEIEKMKKWGSEEIKKYFERIKNNGIE